MKEIEQIYHNDFGVAFYWKIDNCVYKDRVQLVFRETGFYFTSDEITEFSGFVNEMADKHGCCECGYRSKCHRFLLKTPVREVDLAVTQDELLNIKDLLDGVIFNVSLMQYLNNICRN